VFSKYKAYPSDAPSSGFSYELFGTSKGFLSIDDCFVEIKETSKVIEVSVLNHIIVSPLSALSVTDTDTGFSSSSPWLEIADDNMLDQSKQQSIKDSAYQTKQSSIERNPSRVGVGYTQCRQRRNNNMIWDRNLNNF
jgi:hypothetical protein